MPRHQVCLTFDFDAMSGFVARGLKSPTPISRGEFGDIGAHRLLDLLAKRDISSSWYIPGVVAKTYPKTCQRIAADGHEIGHHGWTHVTPASLTRDEERTALLRGNEAIAELTGTGARGYRSPAWDLSPHTVDLLLENGFDYDSSMMGHDCSPYFARSGDQVSDDEPMVFGPETTLVEVPVSWSLDDHPHFEFFRTADVLMPGLRNASSVLENWLDDFDYMAEHEDWGVMTYTFHPYVSGRGHRMRLIERLIDGLRERNAQFATVAEVVDAFLARQ